jgi:hypothetical protein
MIKNIFLATLLLIGGSKTHASLSSQDLARLASQNLIANPGWENGTANWVSSGGTYTTTSTAANVGSGLSAGSWDSSAASQTLTASAFTIPSGAYGRPAVLTCSFQVPTGTATHKLQVFDGTNVLAESTIQSAAQYRTTSVQFVMNGSGSIRPRIISVASNEPLIYLDECYLNATPSPDAFPVAQASFYGGVKWVGTSACNWALSSPSGYTSFSADSDCTLPTGSNVYGAASDMTGQSKIPSIYFASLPAGTYRVEGLGYFRQNNGGAFVCSYQFYDGTVGDGNLVVGAGSDAIGGPAIGRFTQTTAGAKTFQLRAATVSGSPSCELFNSSTPTQDLYINVYRYPTSAELAFVPQQFEYDWTSYTPTFTGFGTVTSPECQHKREGSDQLIRCKFTSGTATATEGRVTLGGGVNTATTSKIPSIQAAGVFFVGNTATVHGGSVLIQPSVGYVNFSAEGVFGSNSTSALAAANGNSIVSNTTAMSFYARVPIDGWTASVTAPLFIGSVTSNSTGMERIERVSIENSSGTASTKRQSGSWISSYTNPSTGQVTATIAAGIFSSPPTCSCMIADGDTTGWCFQNNATTTTSLILRSKNSAGTDTNSDLDVICMGAR